MPKLVSSSSTYNFENSRMYNLDFTLQLILSFPFYIFNNLLSTIYTIDSIPIDSTGIQEYIKISQEPSKIN